MLEPQPSDIEPSPDVARAAAAQCKMGLDDAWDLLGELVGIDSGSEHLPGLVRLTEIMADRWRSLGFTTTTEELKGGVPILRAERVVDPTGPTVLILGHLDTVFPAGAVAVRPFRIDGDRAFGPGVADMKGGIGASWLAVRGAAEIGGLDRVNVRVLNNTDEEVGSSRSRAVIEGEAKGVDLALVFEPARPDGSIVTGRRGVRRYRITVRGKAAHTGVEPWNGINANVELAHKLLALDALNDHDRSLSVTSAVIRGGARVNIVPEEAVVDVDVRVPDLAIASETHTEIERIVTANQVEGASASYEIFGDRPPMAPQPEVAGLAEMLRQVALVQGTEIRTTSTGGGSDGNFVSALGVPTVDGLGPVGGGYHTADEYMWSATLLERAAVVAGFLASLDGYGR